MKDIFGGNLSQKLTDIRNYFIDRVNYLELQNGFEKYDFVLQNSFLEKFHDDCERILKSVVMFDSKLPETDNIVFEGAQGLLLDQEFGFFPHVTRSNTGLKNVVQVSREFGISELEIVYSTRCYTTRHGSGPLKNELCKKAYENIVDKTNIPNQYQGSLRFAYLDLGVLKDSISKDLKSVNVDGLNLIPSVGISCLDQTETVRFYQKDKLLEISNKAFSKHVSDLFSMPMFESWMGDREHVKKLL